MTAVRPTMDVLREMYGEWRCSTELCPGPSFALQVKGGVVWATSECPCGSMNQHYPVPMTDLLGITERALDALFGRCDECGEPCRTVNGSDAASHRVNREQVGQ